MSIQFLICIVHHLGVMNERRRFFYKKSFYQYTYEYLGITNKMSEVNYVQALWFLAIEFCFQQLQLEILT